MPRAQVLVVPVEGRRVVFGETGRGGGPAVILQVGAETDAAALAGDWIAVHEMTHLGLPRLRPADAWFYEGFVTWYTEIERGRAGLQSEAETFRRLVDGFRRGEATGTGRTLAVETVDMHRTHAYWRVYWAGAALAMETELALRRSPGGGLDGLMRALAVEARGPRRAELRELAEVLGPYEARFGLLARAQRHLDRAEFPDVSESYRTLGLEVDATGAVGLSPAPAAVATRRALLEAPVR